MIQLCNEKAVRKLINYLMKYEERKKANPEP